MASWENDMKRKSLYYIATYANSILRLSCYNDETFQSNTTN